MQEPTNMQGPIGAIDDRMRRSIRVFSACAPLLLLVLTATDLVSGGALTPFTLARRGALAALSLAIAMHLKPGVGPKTVFRAAATIATAGMLSSLMLLASHGGAASPHVPFFALGLVAPAFVIFFSFWFCLAFFCGAVIGFVLVGLFTTPPNAPDGVLASALGLVGVAAVIGFAGTVVLRALARQIIDNQRVLNSESASAALAAERARIARDLHDHVGGRLTGIALLAERWKKEVPDSTREMLGLIQQTIQLCVQEIRDVVWALSQMRRDMFDVLATMRQRAEDFAAASNLELSMQFDPDALPDWIDTAKSVALLSIVREALTNVVKHSGATRVSIKLVAEGNRLSLEVSDNGKGIDATLPPGRGLHNMKTRVQEHNGTFSLSTSDASGVAVRVDLPL